MNVPMPDTIFIAAPPAAPPATPPATAAATTPARPAILIVEDELILAKDLQRSLIDFGYDAYAIESSATAAVSRAEERCPDLVIMDIRIKGPLDGIELAGILRQRFSTAIIFLTAHADAAMIERAREVEPHGYLLKPVSAMELGITVDIALDRHRREQAREQYEESLSRAAQEAERENSAKSLFLASMSHEIRTPMNAVIGLTHLLEQTSLSPEQTGLVAHISGASKLLLELITDVLDLSKIEAGELVISREAFNPRVLLKGLHALMRTQADLKGITLELDVVEDLPAALQGDAGRLNQILTNLLTNAIKFTERGGVTLSVRSLGSTPTGSILVFTVRDTGIGIDAAAQARLFTPFIQADESITRRYGGTGLGLAIINSLVKLMGGAVDFTSTVGVGSEFRVVLEFARASAEALAATQTPAVSGGAHPLAGMKVLVVDDSDINLMVTQRILERAGALVCVADNGLEACEKLKLQRVDVVLMDVQMPILDGYEATRRIRADLGLVDLPIIAVTAGALLSERQRATAAGMNDVIIKPFDATALIASIVRHTLGARVAAAEIHSAPQTANGRVVWPEIAGIDTSDARGRFFDDPAMFRASLERFLSEFPFMALPASPGVPAGLAQQASRLHKLKGSAGFLGANAMRHLLAQAEAAYEAGDAARAGELSTELVTHFDALRSSAAGAFEGARTAEAPMRAPNEIGRSSRAVPGEPTDAPPHRSRSTDSDARCRVLVVDDDEILRAHVANLLEGSGYRVGEAASGAEALRALHGGDYRILIADWNMPDMSGLDLCRELRVGRENRDLYVMMRTITDRPQDADLCRAAGADAFVLKSASNEEIIARMATARGSERAAVNARQ